MFWNSHQRNSRFDNYFRVFIGDCTDFQKITENSRIEQYFQVFTGDFNDFQKKPVTIHNSRIEQYFQVFTGDFNDFKELLTIQGLNSMFKCSLVTFMILTK